MSNSSSLYITGFKKVFSFLTQEKKNNNLPKWTESKIKKTQTIKKIVSGNPPNFLVWKKPNKLEFYQKDNEKRKYQLPKKEKIKDIVSSFQTYQILTESGKVWSLANENPFKEVPLLDADQSTFEEIRPVTFFEEKKLFVNSLVMGFASCYYLCNGDQLYASGSNYQGRLGIGRKSKGLKLCLFMSKIGFPKSLQEVMLRISISSQATLIFCIPVETIEMGSSLRLPENKWAWCPKNHFYLDTTTQGEESCPTVNRINPNFDLIRIACGSNISFIHLDFKNTLFEDLRILFHSKKFCDCEIGNLKNQTPVHKALVEFRTKLTIDHIQKKLFGEKKSINKEQTLDFLKWVYYDEISDKDINKLEQTFNLLKLTYPPSVDNTLEKDIAQLYKDDDSKDFKIMVKIDDQEDDNDDEDKEGNYEEIPVHKFILLARSGLFRSMFDQVNEINNLNKVQDYTNKSIESLKILIKYFYTDSIKLTAEEEPEFIVDELSDAVEYYQLNDQCNLESELLKIKKQFDLD
ncbi:btb/poz domain-containing protein [Anaeramoeba flamelloides]|uniref:Btb/poz domain-containing protein n=1 Tax=Anaeramoeba flamelloides TaxID=1746091 RepID=A0AAV7YXQ1_9EUKA|nr:btb/poz domain-containing protein [Anaeramoeba flamelloides]